MPDLAIATLNDFVEAGAMHASLDPTVPVIADADTGYAHGPASPCEVLIFRADSADPPMSRAL